VRRISAGTRRLFAVTVWTAVLCTACGDAERSAGARVPLDDLPRHQYSLVQSLCPRSAGVAKEAVVKQLRAEGLRALSALEAALRTAPDALVETVATGASDGRDRVQRLTVVDLARTHLDGLHPVVGIEGAECLKRYRVRLRRALER